MKINGMSSLSPMSLQVLRLTRFLFTDWIEIDKDYMRDITAKKSVIEEQGDKVLNSLPENDAAAGELLTTLVDYLPKVSLSSRN